ncbi:Glycine betaine methyltransferase [subsurface metagenome]
MRGVLTFLSDSEVEQIHEASLRILKETGVKVLGEKVRKLLAEHGAETNGDIVKIPKPMVEEAVKIAPREITLGAREPKCDLKIPTEEFPFMATSGFSPFVDDFETGERRYSTSSDLKDFALVCDYLDTVDFFSPAVIPNDLPPPFQELHKAAIAMRNNRKHFQGGSITEKTAQWQIRLASAIVGGEAELRRRPIFSMVNCPVAPLMFEKGSAEAMVVLARAGIPIAPMTMVLGGTTAPVTMAGILAMANAEELASLVIIEYAYPGAPMIYCAEAAPANMKTGAINYDAPEYPLLGAGCGQMARFYKVPDFVADISPADRLSKPISPGPRADTMADVESSIFRMALSWMTRTDMTASFGGVDLAISAALDKLVLDAVTYEHARAYLRRFEVNDDTLALDVIHKVGPGGHFLDTKHTLAHFKKEIWSRELSNTFILDPAAKGSFIEKAQAKVREILATHRAPLIEEAVDKEMSRIIKDAERDIGGEQE